MRKLILLVLAAAVAAAAAQAPGGSSTPANYRLVKTVPLNNNGFWDYFGMDQPNRRLYVSAGTKEIIVNADTYAVEGEIGGLSGTHGVAVDTGDEHGFTSNGGSNSSTEFDLKSLRVIKNIPLPIQRPDGFVYDPATNRVFFFNHDSHAAAVDASTGAVLGSILLPSKDAEFAAADGRGHVFDNLEDSSQEIEIDARTLKILHTWPLAPCQHPSGLAIDPYSMRLFVGCHNNMMAIVNANDGKVITTIPIGGGVDATRFDPKFKLAFSSNGGDGGTITVVHEDSPDHYTLLGNIPTEPGARTMELDPETHKLFTMTARFEPPVPGQPRYRRKLIPGSFHLLVYWNH